MPCGTCANPEAADCGLGSLRERVEGQGQARLVGRGGVAVQDALVDGVIDERQRGLQERLRGGLVLGFERGAQFPDLMPQPGEMRPVQFGAFLGLLDAL